MTALSDFLAEHAGLVAAVSVASFIIGLALIPFFVARIPVDYFSYPHRHRLSASARHPLVRLVLAGAKNLLGAVLALAGVLMLFMPGQGLLTLIIGLMIMNYPGKYALERWLILRPRVLSALNWLRVKYGKPLLEPPRKTDADDR